jgi:hypothetical protein
MDKAELMEVKIIPLEEVVMDLRARDWCKFPYPDHPKGCPNYGKKEGCPPSAPIWTDVMKSPYVMVAVRFNLAEWARQLKEKNPHFTDRQARCCLYWQGMVRKRLKDECKDFVSTLTRYASDMKALGRNLPDPNPVIHYCPEAMGVHVFETCYKNGVKLHKNPQDYVWKVAIIGEKK